jgi:hypothetical protein
MFASRTSISSQAATADGTPLENGWFELWSLTRWYTVDEYVRDWPATDRNKFRDIGAAIVFADYSIESWHYAVHFSPDSTMPTAPIYLLHLQPYLVAKSLRGFLAAALVDGPEIYPPGCAAPKKLYRLGTVSDAMRPDCIGCAANRPLHLTAPGRARARPCARCYR